MKKKFVAIIVASTVSLLLGGIVYCGISAFPELLEEDLQNQDVAEVKKANNNHATHYVADFEIEPVKEDATPVLNAAPISESKVSNDITEDNGFGGFISVDAISSIKEIIISSSLSHFIDDSLFENINFVEIQEPVIEEIIAPKVEHVSHHIEESSVEASPVVIKTVKSKARSNKNNSASSKATVECTLLLIGAVDLISMLLVRHRKRHLLR